MAPDRDLSVVTKRGKPRQRTAAACDHCRQRRIKCTASVGSPCELCARAGLVCRLPASMRGARRPSTSTGTDPTTCLTDSSQVEEDLYYAELLDSAASPSRQAEGRQVAYLGETFNLTHLIHATNPAGVPRHQYTTSRPTAPNPNRQLEQQGAFDLPPHDVILELFSAYFTYFHPHYPIIHRTCFALQYQRLEQPLPHLLLLQSVLFAGAGHCDLETIKRAGFPSRYEARLAFFQRAKALYDADFETDKVTLVQSLFLMSFWWNKSTDQKDTWHWLGNAISLAVTIGMHRCTKGSALSIEDQKLWKRIWWSLFAEDKNAAAALGRPVHVRSSDCDIGLLEMSDLAESHESAVDSRIYGSVDTCHKEYVIALSRLAGIVEKIIESSFCAYDQARSDKQRALQGCGDDLIKWREATSPELRTSSSIWAQSLEIAYKRLSDAVNGIPRLIESLLSSNDIIHVPIHVIPSMFASMATLAPETQVDRDSMQQRLAQTKLSFCMIALRELRSTWPVAGWIMALFVKFNKEYDRSTAQPATTTTSAEWPGDADLVALFDSPIHFPNDWDFPILGTLQDPFGGYFDVAGDSTLFSFD